MFHARKARYRTSLWNRLRISLTAAQNCCDRLDDRALQTLRYIERRVVGKCDLTSAFNTLNRILQTAAPHSPDPPCAL